MSTGLFGTYGGRYVPETLIPGLDELDAGWREAQADPAFEAELDALRTSYGGRPTPLTLAERFAPGKRIYLKREDLLHTGAHKLNNALGQAVLPVPEEVLSVAVFVGERADGAEADLVQLYEADDGRVRGRDAVLLREDEVVAQVVDLPWQEGDPGHFDRALHAEGRVVLAGGLGPENVREAIERVRPWAVDASSSLEREPGIKDHDRVRAFVAAARLAAASLAPTVAATSRRR